MVGTTVVDVAVTAVDTLLYTILEVILFWCAAMGTEVVGGMRCVAVGAEVVEGIRCVAVGAEVVEGIRCAAVGAEVADAVLVGGTVLLVFPPKRRPRRGHGA